MPAYKDFRYNEGIMDVFCCVVNGKNNVKEMIKKLGQPQSTVSEKLSFLAKNNLILKDKWSFTPNWKVIAKVFQREIRKQFEEILEVEKLCEISASFEDKKFNKRAEEIRDLMDEIPNTFEERVVKKIMETYSSYLNSGWLEKESLNGIAQLYMDTLKRTDTKEFNKFRKNIKEVKLLFNKLGCRDMKEDLFLVAEGELK